MKLYTIAAAIGVGYIAGNEHARRKTLDTFKQVKSTPPAKAVEDKVSAKVTQLSSKVGGKIAETVPATVGGADSVDTSAHIGSTASERPDRSIIG